LTDVVLNKKIKENRQTPLKTAKKEEKTQYEERRVSPKKR